MLHILLKFSVPSFCFLLFFARFSAFGFFFFFFALKTWLHVSLSAQMRLVRTSQVDWRFLIWLMDIFTVYRSTKIYYESMCEKYKNVFHFHSDKSLRLSLGLWHFFNMMRKYAVAQEIYNSQIIACLAAKEKRKQYIMWSSCSVQCTRTSVLFIVLDPWRCSIFSLELKSCDNSKKK